MRAFVLSVVLCVLFVDAEEGPKFGFCDSTCLDLPSAFKGPVANHTLLYAQAYSTAQGYGIPDDAECLDFLFDTEPEDKVITVNISWKDRGVPHTNTILRGQKLDGDYPLIGGTGIKNTVRCVYFLDGLAASYTCVEEEGVCKASWRISSFFPVVPDAQVEKAIAALNKLGVKTENYHRVPRTNC